MTRALTVTQVNNYMKMVTDAQGPLQSLWIRGELSNFVNHRSGHFYFTVKDAESSLKAVMFRSDACSVLFRPESGMKVLLHGRISVFPRDGVYQLYADEMQPDGEGALALAFEQLKKKLEAEGLFEEERKRPLPLFPERIGVITSPTGAAVRDIINITGRRFPSARVILFPALVQGDGAVPSLIRALRYFNAFSACDVIILGRGGGSLEDLWAFNDEMLAREIAASAIPVISAVGHETDFTISDFVADRRAPTPSAAAELAVPDRNELASDLNQKYERLLTSLSRSVSSKREKLKDLSSRRVLTSYRNILDDRRMAAADADIRLNRVMNGFLDRAKTAFGKDLSLLEAYSPLKVLSRGYSAAFSVDGNVLKSTEQFAEGDRFLLRLSDGEIKAIADQVKKQGIREESEHEQKNQL